jgi:hypothetical protein
MTTGSKKKKELMRLIEQSRQMLEGIEKHGDQLPAVWRMGEVDMTQQEILEALRASIKTLVATQEAIDTAEVGLKLAVEARSAGYRTLRATLGEETMAELGFPDPEGGAKRHTRRVRRAPKRKK